MICLKLKKVSNLTLIALVEDQEKEESAEVTEEELFLTINLKIIHMKTLLRAESKLMLGT
jgi:hypothetical protein